MSAPYKWQEQMGNSIGERIGRRMIRWLEKRVEQDNERQRAEQGGELTEAQEVANEGMACLALGLRIGTLLGVLTTLGTALVIWGLLSL